MKKIAFKLKRSTVRELTAQAIAQVAGGKRPSDDNCGSGGPVGGSDNVVNTCA